MKVSVNYAEHEVDGPLTYERVVELAGKQGNPSVVYQGVRHGDSRREGIMHPGCQPVAPEDGMRFSVVHTGSA